VNPASELAEILSEAPDEARRRERSAFRDLVGDRAIVLYGSGNIGRRAAAALRDAGTAPVAFADAHRAGEQVEGLDVLSPDEAAARYGATAAFVVTVHNPGSRYLDIEGPLRAAGAERVVPLPPLAWAYPGDLLPLFGVDLPHKVLEAADQVRAAFDLLADDRSRREFVEQLRWRVAGDPAGLSAAEDLRDQYFPGDLFALVDDEVFVDGGAYDGDTLAVFAERSGGRFSRYLAIEADPANRALLDERIDALPEIGSRVDVIPLAVGAARGRVRFTADGTSSSASPEGELEVEVAPVDELVDGDRATFLKFDIEGAEPGALRGAAQTIARHRPIVAVSVYHVQDHLWSLPLLLAELAGEDYEFHLRRYAADIFEEVLYAIPAERRI
jgi:FkbM family methyltransferase